MSRSLLASSPASVTSVQAKAQRRAVVGLHGITLLLLALHIYVRTLPPTPEAIPAPTDAEAAWWGLWPVTLLPPLWFWLGVIAVLLVMAWTWTLKPPALQSKAKNDLPWLYLASGLLLIAFYLFPIVHTRWGDAYILARAIAWPDPALRLTHSWQAPLDVYLHSQFWLAFGMQNNWQDAMPVYHLLSPIAGAIYLAALLQLAADRDFAPAWLTYGLMATLGLIQLFFGYVENYSFAAAGILLYLWLGRRVLQGRSPLWLAALLLGITNATHPSTLVLGPSLLYLAWNRWRRGTIPPWRVVMESALPPLLVAGGTLWLMEAGGHGLAALFTTDRPGGSDARWFVPLWGTSSRWEAYTLLSWLHLRDLLNQMLLVAPITVPGLLWIGLVTRRNLAALANGNIKTDGDIKEGEGDTRRFLAIAALFHLLLIVLWNPDYGGQRDWDLFSLAWIPTTLWLVSIARAGLNNATLVIGFVPLILLQALHSAAWVYQNTLPWQWP